MANTVPRAWQVLEAMRARLQEITVANGYRTDAGLDVRTNRTEQVPAAPYLSLARQATASKDDRSKPGDRVLSVVVEAHVPVTLTDAERRAEDISEDIEDALTAYLQMPLALPLRFVDNVLLDRPDGLPVMVAQVLYETEYRR